MASIREPFARAPAASGERPTSVRWSVFSLAFATSLLLYLHRYVFGFLKPTLSQEWGLSNTQLGQLDSAFAVCYAAFQFPLALVADLLGVHLVLSGLLLIWCSGLAVMAAAPNSRWLWVGLAVLGTGQSAVYACLNRIARSWFPQAVRTTLQGAVGILAGRLGALSSSLVFSALLLGYWGLAWRSAVWLLAALGAGQFLLFSLVFRNSPRSHPGVNEAEAQLIEGRLETAQPESDRSTAAERERGDPAPAPATNVTTPSKEAQPAAARLTLHHVSKMSPRSLVNLGMLTLQTLLSTFADNIYSHWIPQFLSQVHGLTYTRMGIYASLPLLGGAVAGLIGGFLNDWLIARTGSRRWSRVSVALAGKGLAAVWIFVALLFYDQPYVFCVLLFFVKLFGDWSLATAWGVAADIGGPATASVFAFSNSIAGIAMVTAPLVFGHVADAYGWRMVFVTAGVTYVLCALSWLFIDCTVPVVGEDTSLKRPRRA